MSAERPDVLRTLGHTVRLLRGRFDAALRHHGLRLGQYAVLQVLWDDDGLTPRDLSERLAVEMPTVTRTVQRMVRDGLVRREAHPNDARSVRILLTSRGRELQAELRDLKDRFTEEIMQPLSRDEQHTLVDMLQRLGAVERDNR